MDSLSGPGRDHHSSYNSNMRSNDDHDRHLSDLERGKLPKNRSDNQDKDGTGRLDDGYGRRKEEKNSRKIPHRQRREIIIKNFGNDNIRIVRTRKSYNSPDNYDGDSKDSDFPSIHKNNHHTRRDSSSSSSSSNQFSLDEQEQAERNSTSQEGDISDDNSQTENDGRGRLQHPSPQPPIKSVRFADLPSDDKDDRDSSSDSEKSNKKSHRSSQKTSKYLKSIASKPIANEVLVITASVLAAINTRNKEKNTGLTRKIAVGTITGFAAAKVIDKIFG